MRTEILKPNIQDSHISVHGINYAPNDFSHNYHIHKECEMYICMSGRTNFYIRDKKYELSTGDIVFINEYVPHETFTYKDTASTLIQFSIDFSSDKTNKIIQTFNNLSGNSGAVFKSGTSTNKELYNCLEEIISESITKKKAYTKYIKATVQKICAILYRDGIIYEPEEFFQKKQVARFIPVMEYINEHYSEKISLDDVSALMHLDKSHFCRIFKEALNTSFVKYLNFVRITKAQKLLLRTNKTITEISAETGFSSPSYFAEAFKQVNFCSPVVYRKMKNKNM